MRSTAPIVLLAALLSSAACTSERAAPLQQPDAAEADRLLDAVDQSAVTAAFEEAARLGYTADLAVVVLDGADAPIGTEALTLRLMPRGMEIADRQRDGVLAGDAPDETPRLRDPLQTALSEDPPFLSPSTRDQYRRTVVGDTVVAGRRLALVEAVLTDEAAEQSVRRVRAAVDSASGQPVVVDVHRRAASTVYDETSRVRVTLAPGADGRWLPRSVETDARVDVPLSPARRVRTTWTVRDVGGSPFPMAD